MAVVPVVLLTAEPLLWLFCLLTVVEGWLVALFPPTTLRLLPVLTVWRDVVVVLLLRAVPLVVFLLELIVVLLTAVGWDVVVEAVVPPVLIPGV